MEELSDCFQFYMIQAGNLDLPEFKRLKEWSFDAPPFTDWSKIVETATSMFEDLCSQHIPDRGQYFLFEHVGLSPGRIIAIESPIADKIVWLK